MSIDEKDNLKLIGKNQEDLKVISAYLQDSVVIVRDMVFLKKNSLKIGKFLSDYKEKKLSIREFSKLYDRKVKEMGMDIDLTKRSLNFGFSGGEKKKNEILQLSILDPSLAILDETDSGLDVDALRTVADGVNAMRSDERSFIIVTHYQRILNYIMPDFVHVLVNGKIVKTGCSDLALELEKDGYEGVSLAK